MKLPTKNETQFVSNAGTDKLPEAPAKGTLRAPARIKIYDPANGEDKFDINVCLLGIPGTGKTEALAQCLLRGLRVFMINTDAGGTGHETIIGRLRAAGKQELLNNLVVASLYNYDDFREFTQKPTGFYPKFYDFKPQVLAWEGFSNFQQNMVSEKTAEMYAMEVDPKKMKEVRAEGLKYEQQDWGVIRNATNSALDDFLSMQVPGVDYLLRVATVHELIGSEKYEDSNKQMQTREILTKRPFIQGAAKNLFSPGFALSLRLVKKGENYTYEVNDDSLGFNKKRAIDLPKSFPADFNKVIDAIEAAYGIKIGQ